MRRIALATLFYERPKLIGAVLAVAAVVALVLLQSALYNGFRRAASQVVVRSGGDVWVHKKGTRVLDDFQQVTQKPTFDESCVKNVRRLVLSYAQATRSDDTPVIVQIVGVDRRAGLEVPWDLVEGDIDELSDTVVAVDKLDAKELGVGRLGDTLTVNGVTLTVGAFTRGVRPFALTPYVFITPAGANAILRLDPSSTTYWVIEATSPKCKDAIISQTSGELRATSARDFARATERRWVEDSGIGLMLRVGSLLSLFVGAIVLAQTLHALVINHRKELATLKALGASTRELLGFVAWQAAVLAALGGSVGLVVAIFVTGALRMSGVAVLLDVATVLSGLGGAVVVTFMAALFAARPILKLDPTEVLT